MMVRMIMMMMVMMMMVMMAMVEMMMKVMMMMIVVMMLMIEKKGQASYTDGWCPTMDFRPQPTADRLMLR